MLHINLPLAAVAFERNFVVLLNQQSQIDALLEFAALVGLAAWPISECKVLSGQVALRLAGSQPNNNRLPS